MATVGERIRMIRDQLGWTQDRLALEAKISKSFLSDVERGERDITSGNLLRIANALGASLDFLMRGENTPAKAENMNIPPELSQAAEQLKLSWGETLTLMKAHNSVVARRTGQGKTVKQPTVQDWIDLHTAIQKAYGVEAGE